MAAPASDLNNVLNTIQSRALRAPDVDWKAVRATRLDIAATAETYPAINYALSQLQEHHSFLPRCQSRSSMAQQTRLDIVHNISILRPRGFQ